MVLTVACLLFGVAMTPLYSEPAEDRDPEGSGTDATTERHIEFLRGKTASYRLNAYVDYRIAEEIVGFVRTGVIPDGTGEVERRARAFCRDLPSAGKDRVETQRLLVRAFTLRDLNGYADLMWARWIEWLHSLEPVHVEPLYGTDAEQGRIRLFFWTYLLRGSVEPVASFVSRFVELTLDGEAVAQEIIHVQHANREANEAVAEGLSAGQPADDDPDGASEVTVRDRPASIDRKVALLRRYAAASPCPAEFLRGAVAGQRGAGKWDGAFKRLLERRF